MADPDCQETQTRIPKQQLKACSSKSCMPASTDCYFFQKETRQDIKKSQIHHHIKHKKERKNEKSWVGKWVTQGNKYLS